MSNAPRGAVRRARSQVEDLTAADFEQDFVRATWPDKTEQHKQSLPPTRCHVVCNEAPFLRV